MQRLRKGDNVQVLAGKDKGKTGAIEKVLLSAGMVFVSGANLYKRHVRKMNDIEGGIIDLPKPLKISKVGLVCPSCKKVTRVGFKVDGDSKVRICKKCKKEVK